MAKNKTIETTADVYMFINSFVQIEQRKEDCYQLINLMSRISGKPAKMWGPSIIGFDKYHYKYASGHHGEAPLIAFCPRKKEFSLYVFTGLPEHEGLLTDLGKYRRGKACIYIKRLADINLLALENLMRSTIRYSKEQLDKV